MDSETRRIETDTVEDGIERAAEPSLLDRGISLPLTAATLVAGVAILAGAALRLPELNRWAFNPTEGRIALAARDLVRGNTIPDDMLGQPFAVEWVALFMFLGDTVLSISRVAMAVAGVVGIIALLGLRQRIGTAPVVAAMALLALSPTLVSASRTLDGGALVFTLVVLLLASIYWSTASDGLAPPAIAGASLGLLLLSGPLGLPAAIIAGAGYALLGDGSRWAGRNQMLAAGVGFVAAFVLAGSALLTQPSSLYEAPIESLAMLLDDHLGNAGDSFHLAVANLLINEPLIVLLAIAGAALGRDSALVRGLAIWAVVALVIVSLLGNASAGGFGLALIPLGLLAGSGVVEVLARLRAPGQGWAWPATFVACLVVLVFAFVSLVGLTDPEPDRSTGDTIVRFLLIAVVVLAPVGVVLARINERLQGQRIALTLLAAGLLLSAIGLRSAILSATEWQGEAGNLLAVPAMSDGIPVIIDRLQRISRDITRTERDARMPVGGIGLRIALDEEIEHPFAWYFREYPNLTIFDPDRETYPEGTQLIILSGSRDADVVAPGLPGETYLFQYEEPGYVSSPDWGDLIGDAFSVDGWRTFASFVINRDTSEPVPAREFQLRAVPVVAERFAVSTGPYNLNDRAGIGTAAGQFNQPRGIAIDDAGGVYVVDAGNARLQHFDAAGEFDQFIGEETLALFPGGQGGAGGMALDDEGNIYVADTWNHQIKVFAPTGELIRSWGSFFDAQDDPELAEEQPGAFYGPRGVAIHEDLVYVTDTGNERVQVFDLTGEFVRSFGSLGSDTGQLIEPVGIAISGDGTVFVADSHNARLSRFDLEGEALDPWPVDLWAGQQFFEPYVATGPDGRVYASDSISAQIAVFSPEGDALPPLSNASLLRPYGMAVDPDGMEMLVTDGLTNAVIRISLAPPN